MTAPAADHPAHIHMRLNGFFVYARVNTRYPSPLLTVLHTGNAATADLAIHGVPVTVTSLTGPMTLHEVNNTGHLIYSLGLAEGAHVVVTGPSQVGMFPSRLADVDTTAEEES